MFFNEINKKQVQFQYQTVTKYKINRDAIYFAQSTKYPDAHRHLLRRQTFFYLKMQTAPAVNLQSCFKE